MPKQYATIHGQEGKGRRVVVGNLHKYRDCPSLKSRTGVFEITGSILKHLPECSWCVERAKKGGR